MTCRLYEEQLSSYLDQELPAARAARLEAHLKTCQRCREELEAMGGIASQLRAASSLVEVSHDFDKRVLRAFGYYRVTGWQKPVKSYLRPLVLAAVLLLGMLAAVWNFLTRPYEPAPQPAPAYSVGAPAATGAPAPGVPERERRR